MRLLCPLPCLLLLGWPSGSRAGCANVTLAATKSGSDTTCSDTSLEYAHFWPLGDTDGCHGWRATANGEVHDNSANNIRCSEDGQSLLYDQYAGNIDCSDATAVAITSKSFTLNQCHQGMPPSLYDTALNLDCCDPGGDSCMSSFFGQPSASTQATSDEVIFWNGVQCTEDEDGFDEGFGETTTDGESIPDEYIVENEGQVGETTIGGDFIADEYTVDEEGGLDETPSGNEFTVDGNIGNEGGFVGGESIADEYTLEDEGGFDESPTGGEITPGENIGDEGGFVDEGELTSGGISSGGLRGGTTNGGTTPSFGEKCETTIPQDGTDAVQLAFYANPLGGEEGDECPSSCVDSENPPVMQQWYAIEGETWSGCFEWPGHSGENSMTQGLCDPVIQAFKYDQFTTCDCSGNANTKTVYVEKCIVDKPATICSKVIDFSACEKSDETTTTASGETTSTATGDEKEGQGGPFQLQSGSKPCCKDGSTPVQGAGCANGERPSGDFCETSTGGSDKATEDTTECVSDIPTSAAGAILVGFYKNTKGGVVGEDCPSSCFDTTIVEQWYAIADDKNTHCFQWPGHSGQNSMKNGYCHAGSKTFSYDQFNNCDCSETPYHKGVYVDRCVVVDENRCGRILDFSSCAKVELAQGIAGFEEELKELKGELKEVENTSMATGGRPSKAWLLIVFCALGWFAPA